jgi:hypothetical protein
MRNKQKQNGINETISDMPNSIREKTSQRFGITTKNAINATLAIPKYIRWLYAGVPQSAGASRGAVVAFIINKSSLIRNQATPTASIVAKILQADASGFKLDFMEGNMPSIK